MGRIVVTEFVSLDGVMEDPGGAEDYRHGGWTFEFDRGEGDEFKLEETRETDALLLGRKTYEGFAAAWPSREGEFADKFNSMPKYVVSTTLKEPGGTTRPCSTATPPRRRPSCGRPRRETSWSTAAHSSCRR